MIPGSSDTIYNQSRKALTGSTACPTAGTIVAIHATIATSAAAVNHTTGLAARIANALPDTMRPAA